MTERETAITACCRAGLSVNQTARELGLTPGQVTLIRARLGLSFAKGRSIEATPPADYHDAIASMRLVDAVAHLTHLLDQILWQGNANGLEPIEGCVLTPKEAQFLYFLDRRAGHTVPTEAMMHALYSDRASGDIPDAKVLYVLACKVRRKLSPHAMIIRNHAGYALALAPGIALDWNRGISPVARLSAKWARQDGP